VNSRWINQVFATGIAPTGVKPQTATTDASETDAIIQSGQAYYGDPVDNAKKLTFGGLFSELGNNGVSIIVEDFKLPGVTTFDLVDVDGNLIKTIDATTVTKPFVIPPFAYIKIATGTAGETFGFLARLEGTRIL
jgi:hypothetical protein